MNAPTDAEKARQIADKLQADVAQQGGEFTDWFEELYAKANGDAAMVPWGDEKPHPGLVDWMAENQQGDGARAIDVGCGLGDNAAFLAKNGYDVTAIDLSKSAISWAARRFDHRAIDFRQADLFSLPEDLKGQFDLVHETYTLQALPQAIRPAIFAAIADLLAPNGRLLVITRSWAQDIAPDGPPWPLANSELKRFEELGLEAVSLSEFSEEKLDGRKIPHFRAEYKKPC